MLRAYNIDAEKQKDILYWVKETRTEHEMACRTLFSALHDGHGDDMALNHPLQFYQESVKYWLAKEKRPKAAETETKVEPETQPSATAEA